MGAKRLPGFFQRLFVFLKTYFFQYSFFQTTCRLEKEYHVLQTLKMETKMRADLKILIITMIAIFITAGNALATNITIYDGSSSAETGWYGKLEDQEVEPNCVKDQAWDLEAFFLTDSTLTMVGGYNFISYGGFDSGDLFIDTSGINSGSTYGYDYALKLDLANSKYSVYTLDQYSTFNLAYYLQNNNSNPWTYNAEANDLIGTFSLSYLTGLNDNDFENILLGGVGSHYSVSLDLSDFLASGTDFIAHYTMGCGNDNLMGQGTTSVPEPATLMLLGTGLLGIGLITKRKIQK